MIAESALSQWEAEKFIEHLTNVAMEHIGTESWFELHKRLILLSQQSIMEVNSMCEESVKEWFILYQKIPILVFEAIQINVWKEKVLPLLFQHNKEPSNTFLLYSVLYHENITVTLLENILYHSESVVSMGDAVIDLIDYAVDNITALLYSKTQEAPILSQNLNSCYEELMEKKSKIDFDIQLKCISILRYLAEFADDLPLSAVSRMLCTHDVPYFFAQLIEHQPWKKTINGELYVYESDWKKIEHNESDKIIKIEAQVWIGLREFIVNPNCSVYYEMTQFRKSQFLKLQKYLHENILDQISPLVDLRRYLSYLNMTSRTSNNQRPVTVEIIPEMKLSIMEKFKNRWKKLAKHQSKALFTKNAEEIKNKALILNDAYDLDKLDIVSGHKCSYCNEAAIKRCSKCKLTWYCKRECQVKDWPQHKELCLKMVESEETQ